MKLKSGMKVRVKSDLVSEEKYGTNWFVDEMSRFKGKIVTIDKIAFRENEWLVKEDTGNYKWTEDMFVLDEFDYADAMLFMRDNPNVPLKCSNGYCYLIDEDGNFLIHDLDTISVCSFLSVTAFVNYTFELLEIEEVKPPFEIGDIIIETEEAEPNREFAWSGKVVGFDNNYNEVIYLDVDCGEVSFETSRYRLANPGEELAYLRDAYTSALELI